jgi:hypothetical protein
VWPSFSGESRNSNKMKAKTERLGTTIALIRTLVIRVGKPWEQLRFPSPADRIRHKGAEIMRLRLN